ncbi:hypothetical protein [Mucilaginibacter sp. SJ]|nr:hypothetical protein [Mucilaginibacter sp. SJ]WEA01832.1 hypothetical protein MusilaSJ_02700 [Mucilaginibacter sp. SJ]
MDFFTEQGSRLKTELFMKAPALNLNLGKAKDKSQDQGVGV